MSNSRHFLRKRCYKILILLNKFQEVPEEFHGRVLGKASKKKIRSRTNYYINKCLGEKRAIEIDPQSQKSAKHNHRAGVYIFTKNNIARILRIFSLYCGFGPPKCEANALRMYTSAQTGRAAW